MNELLGGNVHVLNVAAGRRHRRAVLARTLQMEDDSFTDLPLDFFEGAAGGDAARKVGNIGGGWPKLAQ